MLATFVYAQKIEFRETKYIYTLDNEFSKKGNIEFKEELISLRYLNSQKTISCDNEFIYIDDNNETKKFPRDEKIEYSVFFSVIKAVYEDDMLAFGDNFNILQKEGETLLTPDNEYLSRIIEKIVFKKNGKKLNYLLIYFTNRDTIKIEQID